MPRGKLKVVNELGNIVEKPIAGSGAAIVPEDGDSFEPAVTQRVEYDHEGQMSSITTNCGETENRRESDELPELTVEGVITKDQIDDAKTISQGDSIRLISDVHQGKVTVRRITIEQNTDIIEFIPNSGEAKLAFQFQLQLRQPE